MALYWELTISSSIRDLIQKGTYEQIICDLMNESKRIFPSKYARVKDQSNGECDFIDIVSKKKYDAKILFSNTQCQLIARGLKQLEDWVRSVYEEISEVSGKLFDNDRIAIKNTILFRELSDRLASVRDDEDAILFIPFPIVPESEKSVFLPFASDILSVTYGSIVAASPGKFEGKHTFIIYPSVIDQKVVLRDLTSRRKEYMPIDPLSPYITYAIKEHPD